MLSVRRHYAVPLLIVSLAVLGGAPFYWQPNPCTSGQSSCSAVVALTSLRLTGLAPLMPSSSGSAAIYWIAAIPIAFALLVAYCRRRSAAAHAWAALIAVALLLTLVIVLSPRIEPAGWARAGVNLARAPNLTVRGLVALLILGAGLVIFATLERSAPMLIVALIFAGLAVLACLYNVSNKITFGLPPAGWPLANLLLPGGWLLMAAVVFALSELRTRPLPIAR